MKTPVNSKIPSMLFTLLVFFLFSDLACAQEAAPTRIVDIDGPSLMTQRPDEAKWFLAFESMTLQPGESLWTDSKTSATIEFHSGGRLILGPDTMIQVVNGGEEQPSIVVSQGKLAGLFTDSAQPLLVKSGNAKPLNINEAEFYLKVDKKSGKLEFRVAAGNISPEGQPSQHYDSGYQGTWDGTAWRFVRYAAYGSPLYTVRETALDLFDADTRYVLRPIVRRALWHVPGRYSWNSYYWGRYYYGNNYYYTRSALRVLADPQYGLTREAAYQLDRHVGYGAGNLLRVASDPPKPVSQVHLTGVIPNISWEKCKGAKKYAVVISRDSEGKDVVWYTLTPETEVSYPRHGPELSDSNRYYLFVMPLRDNGEPHTHKGRNLGRRISFSGTGHKPRKQLVYGLNASKSAAPPQLSWQPFRAANRYKVQILDSREQIVWADASKDINYRYPSSARPLKEGAYWSVVRAYDDSGMLMGTSKKTELNLTEWSAAGVDGF